MLKTLIISGIGLGVMPQQQPIAVADTTLTSVTIHQNDSSATDQLLEYAHRHLGKRYKYGGTGKGGFDCSGFVMHCFEKFGVQLPHTSEGIAFLGHFVSHDHAQSGDLIFFTGRNSNSENVGHVGIVTEHRDGKIYFIHASVQSGVVISCIEEDYYKQRFMFIKRVYL